MTLSPARLEPVFYRRPWGVRSLAPLFPRQAGLPEPVGEAWMTSLDCRFAGGPWQGKTLGEAWAQMPPEWKGAALAGSHFPLLVKFIFTAEKLSVQVHPDDAYAARHEAPGSRGKTEMWHVLGAQPGAEVLAGWNPGVTRESFESAIAAGAAEQCLARVPVRPGGTIFIPAGMPHTIGAGLILCEIQQYSDLTYRVYDYNRRDRHGRARELHIAKALDVMRFGPQAGGPIEPVRIASAGARISFLASCAYFAAEKWEFDSPFLRSSANAHFDLLIFVQGSGHISWKAAQTAYGPAHVWLLPAMMGDYCLAPDEPSAVLRAYVPSDAREFTASAMRAGADPESLSAVVFA